jgi:lipopolysaccharide transport system ATP-binding protein
MTDSHNLGALAADFAVLHVHKLGKEYRLYDSPRARLHALLTGRMTYRSHWALNDVSFTLGRGQCMGVVGDNGAGKSSLLKLLAGTLQPSTGYIERIGRVTAILELGAGFHPDFTGRENLYFGGNLIGISSTQMMQLEAGIIEFAELTQAIDRPVKTYSSGMVVRLAFALVTAVEPDVLIIDEALAVGDQHFQKKCVERIEAFRRNGCTILFCSHSMYLVRQLCDVAIWMDQGTVRIFSHTEEVISAYESHVRAQAALHVGSFPLAEVDDSSVTVVADQLQDKVTTASIIRVEIDKLGNGDIPLLESSDLVITVHALTPGDECPHIGVMLEQLHGVGITSAGTHKDGVNPVRLIDGRWRACIVFPELPLHTGEYVLSVYLFDSKGLVVYDQWPNCVKFRYVYEKSTPGLVSLPHRWIQGP